MTEPKPRPANVHLGEGSVLVGDAVFKRFYAEHERAVVVGKHCHLEGIQLALGKNARLVVGDYVYAAHLIMLAEQEIRLAISQAGRRGHGGAGEGGRGGAIIEDQVIGRGADFLIRREDGQALVMTYS